ncbi:MAG: OmpA family protein [Bacteroidota bacterium]|nr:OmpA family protein [Bacteroidota bacterium]
MNVSLSAPWVRRARLGVLASLAALMVSSTGCVTSKQYEALQVQLDEAELENTELRLARQDAEISSRELEGKLSRLTGENDALADEANMLGTELQRLRDEVSRLTDLNEALTSQSSGRLSDIAEENRQLLEDVMAIREELQRREDALNQLEKDLNEKSRLLEARSQRVEELESLLEARERAAEALRARLSEALLGFQGKGLNVEQRNGKVYVSMEAKLLFSSGSAEVDVEGQAALTELATVIAEQSDLEIVVEGHTDTDKVSRTTTPKNNWELSVLRATAVVNILLANPGVDPSMLAASGRSEFHPVDPEDKAKNRRIEVILAPNLDSLFELISD